MSGTDTVLVSGAGGTAGKVTVNANASITVSGSGATALHLQGNGAPIVNVASGVSVTGGVGGAAIDSRGTESFINNSGTLSTVDGAQGLAITNSGGYAVVTNAGTILGNLALAPGQANLVDNLASGSILAGASLDLGGAGGTLRNAGRLASGSSTLGTTTITGNLVQTGSGVLVVRADQVSVASDQFRVTGTANLSGSFQGAIYTPSLAKPRSFQNLFLTAPTASAPPTLPCWAIPPSSISPCPAPKQPSPWAAPSTSPRRVSPRAGYCLAP